MNRATGKIVGAGSALAYTAIFGLCAAAQTAAHVPTVSAQATNPAIQPPQTPALSLPDQIATILAVPAVARDHWGITVTALDGAPIYALNDAQLFHPASNAKLFTTAAALALMGAERRLTTEVAIAGKMDKRGVLHGDLKLIGAGDPSFGTNDLPYVPPSLRPKPTPSTPSVSPSPIADIEELADKVYASGLRRIDGDVLGDDSRFNWEPYPPDWQLDDLVYGYAAPVSALSVHDNEVRVKVTPGAQTPDSWPHATIQTDPDTPYFAIEDDVLTDRGSTRGCDAISYRRPPDTKALTVYGDMEPQQPPCTQAVAVADPAEYAAVLFKEALQRRGIAISGPAKAKHLIWKYPDAATRVDPFVQSSMTFLLPRRPYIADAPAESCNAQSTATDQQPAQTVIASHQSQPLAQEIAYTLKVSQNLHAEVILRDLGAAYGCEHTHASGLTVLRAYLPHIGISPGDFFLEDGSGLSTKDLVAPRAVAKLLAYAANDPKTNQSQPWFAVWKSSLPIGGEDGSLASRFRQPPLQGHVFAKTGTIGEARALSGYLDCASGRTVIFSILVDNHLPGTSDDRDAMDRIVAAIQAAE